MHAEHADKPRALTGLWVGASKAALALRAFVLAPAYIRLLTGGAIDVQVRPACGSVMDDTANKSG